MQGKKHNLLYRFRDEGTYRYPPEFPVCDSEKKVYSYMTAPQRNKSILSVPNQPQTGTVIKSRDKKTNQSNIPHCYEDEGEFKYPERHSAYKSEKELRSHMTVPNSNSALRVPNQSQNGTVTKCRETRRNQPNIYGTEGEFKNPERHPSYDSERELPSYITALQDIHSTLRIRNQPIRGNIYKCREINQHEPNMYEDEGRFIIIERHPAYKSEKQFHSYLATPQETKSLLRVPNQPKSGTVTRCKETRRNQSNVYDDKGGFKYSKGNSYESERELPSYTLALQDIDYHLQVPNQPQCGNVNKSREDEEEFRYSDGHSAYELEKKHRFYMTKPQDIESILRVSQNGAITKCRKTKEHQPTINEDEGQFIYREGHPAYELERKLRFYTTVSKDVPQTMFLIVVNPESCGMKVFHHTDCWPCSESKTGDTGYTKIVPKPGLPPGSTLL